MGKALVINANQLKYQANSNSNETVFRATEDFFASLVDNALVKLRQTRLASNAQDSTQNMTATVEVSALVFGNVYFIYKLCIFTSQSYLHTLWSLSGHTAGKAHPLSIL